MPERYKRIWMWVLYSALFILTLCLQSVLFGNTRIFSAKLCFLPMLTALVAMFQGAERGGGFGLAAGLLCAFAGLDGGALNIVVHTALGLAVGFLCEYYFTSQLLSAVILSAAALLFSQGVLLAWKQFLGIVGFGAILPMLLQCALSLLLSPLFYLAIRAISGLYHPKKI